MAKLTSLTVELELQQAAFNKGMADAAKQLAKVEDAAKKSQKSLSGMESGMRTLAAGAAALATAFAVFKSLETLVKATDQINSLAGSFKALLGDAGRAGEMMTRVFGVVDRTGAPLEAVGAAMQRLTIAMRGLGASTGQIETVTETFIQLAKIGGSSMAETSSALVQLGQALASGKLGGDEFKSIRENAPLVADAIAQSLQVTSGELAKLAENGALTADVVANALLQAADRAKAGFAQLPQTFEQSMNRMQAQATLFFASFDKASGTSEIFKATTDYIAANLKRWTEELDSANGKMTLMQLAAEAVKIALQAFLVIASDVAFVFEAMARSAAAVGQELVAFASGDLKNLGSYWKASEEASARARVELDKYQAAVMGLGKTMDAVFGKVYGDGETGGFPLVAPRKLKPPGGGGTGTGTGKKGKSEAEQELEALRKRGEALAASVDPLNAYNQKVAEYNELLAKAAISSITWSKAMEKAREDLTAVGDAMTASVDPAFAYELEMRKINQAYRDGAIEVETWVKLMEKAKAAMEEKKKGGEKTMPEKIAEMADSLAESIGAGVGEFFQSIMDGSMSASQAFGKMVESIISDLARLLAEFAAKEAAKFIIKSIFGGGPSVGGASATPSMALASMPVVGASWNAQRSLSASPLAGAGEAAGASSVGAAGASPWNVVINNNAPGVDVSSAPRSDGGLEITVERVRAALTQDVMRGGNPFARSLEHAYALGRGR